MYIQNSSSFLYSAKDEGTIAPQTKETNARPASRPSLENFSEKAMLTFEAMSADLPAQEKDELVNTLNSIGKAAAFASMNGFETQSERMVVSQYFENFDGVLSDDAIKKMIYSKLDNPDFEKREFLQRYAQALDEPLKRINIRV